MTGISRDPAWRRRAADAAGTSASRRPAGRAADCRPPADSRTRRRTPKPSWCSRTSPPARSVPIRCSLGRGAGGDQADIGDCTRCKLHRLGRTQVVFGVGNPEAASDVRRRGTRAGRHAGHPVRRPRRPAAHQDHRGDRPAPRRGLHRQRASSAGRRATATRSRTKSRPCEPFLFRQIDCDAAAGDRGARHLRGASAAGTQDPISRLRGRVFDYRGAELVPDLPSGYLLRSPVASATSWEDMKRVRALLGRRPPGLQYKWLLSQIRYP